MSWFGKMFGKGNNAASPAASEASPTSAGDDNNAIAPDEADEVLAEDNRSLLLQLISKNGLSMGMDLSKVPLPTFILEPRSLLEKLSDTMIHPEIFTAIPLKSTPEERMIAVVRWYLSAYHVRPKGTKKPFNPVLGETFSATFGASPVSSCKDHVTWYAQQVSHHPPVSAFFARDDAGTIVVQGCFAPKSKFLGNSAASIGGGAFRIYLPQLDEVYYLNWPSVYVRGVLFGTLLMEVCGNVVIACPKNNLTASIDFQAKGFFGGVHHHVAGAIFRGTKAEQKKAEQLYTLDGFWTGKTVLKAVGGPHEEVLFDTATNPLGAIVADLTETAVDANGGPNDKRDAIHQLFPSRATWGPVAEAIAAQDQDGASKHKQAIEQYQRDLRTQRAERNENFTPSLFTLGPEDEWVFIGPHALPLPPIGAQ
jgi:hypothetical protein